MTNTIADERLDPLYEKVIRVLEKQLEHHKVNPHTRGNVMCATAANVRNALREAEFKGAREVMAMYLDDMGYDSAKFDLDNETRKFLEKGYR